ncbi:MAG: NAD(P)H-dependent oxidoreductase subunit E, partial [Prochloraceae cyanobacterium]
MKSLRRYWETHNGGTSPLLQIHGYLRLKKRPLQPSEIAELAQQVALPEATVRGAISYYADLQDSNGAMRVCQGTSCMLAGAG